MILDEPTTGLDVLAQRHIRDFVLNCRERGKTVVFSSHVMPEAEKLCDRVGIIHGGRMVAEGTVPELKSAHGTADLEDVFVRLAGESGGAAA